MTRCAQSEDEVDFAIAQFGTERTKAYADAVSAARADLAEGFRLRQQLDDAFEDSDRQRREWTLQIIANSERAQRRLGEQQAAFTDLRRQEVGAAATLKDVRRDPGRDSGALGARAHRPSTTSPRATRRSGSRRCSSSPMTPSAPRPRRARSSTRSNRG